MEAGQGTPFTPHPTISNTHTFTAHPWATARAELGMLRMWAVGRGRRNTLPPVTHGCSSCHLPGVAGPRGTGSGKRGPHSHTGTHIHGLYHCKGPGLQGETRQDESGWTLPAKIPCPSAQIQETAPHPDSSSHRAASCGPLCSSTVAQRRC